MKVYEIIREAATAPPKLTPAEIKTAVQSNQKMQQDIIDLYEKLKTDEAGKKSGLQKVYERAGKLNWIIKLFSVGLALGELVYLMDVCDEMYIKGDLDPYSFREKRQALITIWMIRTFAPFLAGIVRMAAWVVGVGGFLLQLATLGTIPVAGIGSIFAIATETVLFTAISAFLQSKTFELWCAQHVSTLAYFGYWPEEAYDELRKLFSEIPVINTWMKDQGMGARDHQAQEKKRRNPAGAAADAAAQAKIDADNARIEKNTVRVAGVRVTDQDGYLDPMAYNNPDVQYAIKYTPDDPNVKRLATVPKKAGVDYSTLTPRMI